MWVWYVGRCTQLFLIPRRGIVYKHFVLQYHQLVHRAFSHFEGRFKLLITSEGKQEFAFQGRFQ